MKFATANPKLKSPISGAVDNFLPSLQFARTIVGMNLFEDLEAQFEAASQIAGPIRVTLDGVDVWLAGPQAGNDFLLGTHSRNLLIARNSLNTKVWARPPVRIEVSFSEVLEQLSWPRVVRFNLVNSGEMCLGCSDGYLRLQSGQGAYFRAIDSINFMSISPVDNLKPSI